MVFDIKKIIDEYLHVNIDCLKLLNFFFYSTWRMKKKKKKYFINLWWNYQFHSLLNCTMSPVSKMSSFQKNGYLPLYKHVSVAQLHYTRQLSSLSVQCLSKPTFYFWHTMYLLEQEYYLLKRFRQTWEILLAERSLMCPLLK